MIFKKLLSKLSLVRCFNHPSASSSARSKTKSEQEHEEGPKMGECFVAVVMISGISCNYRHANLYQCWLALLE